MNSATTRRRRWAWCCPRRSAGRSSRPCRRSGRRQRPRSPRAQRRRGSSVRQRLGPPGRRWDQQQWLATWETVTSAGALREATMTSPSPEPGDNEPGAGQAGETKARQDDQAGQHRRAPSQQDPRTRPARHGVAFRLPRNARAGVAPSVWERHGGTWGPYAGLGRSRCHHRATDRRVVIIRSRESCHDDRGSGHAGIGV